MKTNRKLWWMMSLVALLLVAMLVLPTFAACAPKTIEWRWQIIQPGPGDITQDKVHAMFQRVEARSEGRFKLTPHYGKELGYEAKEYVSVLSQGLLESAGCPLGTVAHDIPWMGADTLPFMVFSPEERTVAINATRPFVDEYFRENGVYPLMHYNLITGRAFAFTDKKLMTVDNMKGLKIRVWAKEQAEVYKHIGASPLFVAFSEVYLALQRGTIDAALTGGTGGITTKLYEVIKYAIPQWAICVHEVLGISQKAWDDLPKDIQQIMLEEAAAFQVDNAATIGSADAFEFEARDLTDLGLEVFEMDKATYDALDAAAEATRGIWLEKAGPKGEQVLNAVKAALAEHRR